MYSVVLATVLTAGAATPDFGFGCYGCYGSCSGSGYGCDGCYGGGVVSAAPVTGVPSAPTSHGIPATVVVKAPADVRLMVNGQATPLNRTEETFTTPNLEPGNSYSY